MSKTNNRNRRQSEVEALRAEVRRAQKLVGDKVRRIEKSTGAKIKDSMYDPRKDDRKIAGYNVGQLRQQLANLDQFRARGTQFVAGSNGAAIPKHLAKRFLSVQATYNKKAAALEAEIASLKLPGGATIAEREAAIQPDKRKHKAKASNRPLGRFDIAVSSFTSAKSMTSIESMLRKKITDSYQAKALKSQRFQLKQLLDQAGESELAEKFAKLSDKQFNVLWNYTDFPDSLSTRYESLKNMSVQEETKTSNEFSAEISEAFKWARKIR